MKNILFRTDSSDKIGTGHVMRSLVLAEKFYNDKIIFASRDLPNNINYKIKNAGYKIEELKTNEIDELISLINIKRIDLIVIDHYGISYEDEKKIKKKTNIKIFVLDDNFEKHHADILLNHNIYATKNAYKGLVPNACELRCGFNHLLIREEFVNEKTKKNNSSNSPNKKILISMGGADSRNLSTKILSAIKYLKKIEVTLVTTRANKNIHQLKSFINNYQHKIILEIDTNEMAKLMRTSDLIITTPSVTSNEVYYMKIPFIAIKTENNQEHMFKFLKNNNFNVLDSFSSEKLKIMLNKITF